MALAAFCMPTSMMMVRREGLSSLLRWAMLTLVSMARSMNVVMQVASCPKCVTMVA